MPERSGYDAHTHTSFSDGRNTVMENVRAAEAVGLACVAITDHFHEPGEWFDRMLAGIRAARQRYGVRVLAGVESVIVNTDGEVSIGPEEAARLDIVLADVGARTVGIGTDTPTTKARLLDNVVTCMSNACQSPLVHVIAHPFNLGRLPLQVQITDLPRTSLQSIARAFVQTDTAFELMNQMHWWFPDVPVGRFTHDYAELAALFAEEGVKFVLGSDAHSCGAVGNLRWAMNLVELAGIPAAQIVDLARLAPRRAREP
ncbi:MAG: PHP domain-containing protein [Armatimonadota bacterium]|jgi:histidinol phosphatase-like PHP family hydrolase